MNKSSEQRIDISSPESTVQKYRTNIFEVSNSIAGRKNVEATKIYQNLCNDNSTFNTNCNTNFNKGAMAQAKVKENSKEERAIKDTEV